MKTRYTRKALGQISEIRAYIEQDRPGAGKMVADAIRTAVARLAQYPELGRQGQVAGTREMVVPRLPFIVIYRVEGDFADMLLILHGAMEWPSRSSGH